MTFEIFYELTLYDKNKPILRLKSMVRFRKILMTFSALNDLEWPFEVVNDLKWPDGALCDPFI